MNKARGVPGFSHIVGSPESFVVERTPLGSIIEEQLWNFPNLCPALRILQYVIMPDHVHFALFAQQQLPRVLGSYIGMMKVKCGQLARERLASPTPVFEKDFYDRILRRAHKLDTICNYIRQNPYRLLVRQVTPDFFRRINNVEIYGRLWQAYGNLQLLDNPFKAPVVIHRADSEALKNVKRNRWKHLAENGGVLISPFISPEEKEVRRQCEAVNGKVILLSNEPFGERSKPAAHNFELCAAGRLLILSPMEALPPDREVFLYLNSIAESLSLNPRKE
ncbi:MAG: hypothetical protein K2F87_06590 [Muribaculaceae bacterium]|nr:hypothetical protein [Muribaculaceae bacterium]